MFASSWNEITPCNLSLDRLAKSVKDGVFSAGGYPLEFGTISSVRRHLDGPRGHALRRFREVIADSVETVMQAERLDEARCCWPAATRARPGMLMAAARLDPALGVPVRGLDLSPGVAKLSDGSEREVAIIDAFEAVGPAPARAA